MHPTSHTGTALRSEPRAQHVAFSSARCLLQRHGERLAWGVALLILALLPPEPGDLSFCPLSWFSLPCPGCGLGNAISLALRFRFQESMETHWLGLPVLAWMALRLLQPLAYWSLRSLPTFNSSAP